MRRDLPRLADTTFDLLIVGAGIYGACAAWDAALRGLTVAVVDQGDFLSTSIVQASTRGKVFRIEAHALGTVNTLE